MHFQTVRTIARMTAQNIVERLASYQEIDL